MDTICVYDKHDLDGIASGVVLYEQFRSDAYYIPVAPSFDLEDIRESYPHDIQSELRRNFIFADVCPPKDDLEFLSDIENVQTTVIDHHESAKSYISLADNFIFDKYRSACVLCWQFFDNGEVPQILKYIQDRDLWEWSFENTEEVLLALDLKVSTYEPEEVCLLSNIISPYFKNRNLDTTLEREGDVIKRYRKALMQDCQKNIQTIEFEGHKTGVVNSPLFRSKLGERIYNDEWDIAMIWYVNGDNQVKVSLRTNSEDINLSKICSSYGGGGQSDAGGFAMELQKFYSILEN